MFLSTVHLAGSVSSDQQDAVYIKIIENELEVRRMKIAVNADKETNVK